MPQQQAVVSNSIGANGSSAPQHYAGPTGTQADEAVAFAYDQLGCPYVYGGTGPCHMGFDCSGLAQAAWASAGVQIPRDSYEQWAALPHVPLSSIEPGDLLIYDGEGHVAMYVGGGYIIDAPQTGENVEKIPDEHALVRRQPRRRTAPVTRTAQGAATTTTASTTTGASPAPPGH